MRPAIKELVRGTTKALNALFEEDATHQGNMPIHPFDVGDGFIEIVTLPTQAQLKAEKAQMSLIDEAIAKKQPLLEEEYEARRTIEQAYFTNYFFTQVNLHQKRIAEKGKSGLLLPSDFQKLQYAAYQACVIEFSNLPSGAEKALRATKESELREKLDAQANEGLRLLANEEATQRKQKYTFFTETRTLYEQLIGEWHKTADETGKTHEAALEEIKDMFHDDTVLALQKQAERETEEALLKDEVAYQSESVQRMAFR